MQVEGRSLVIGGSFLRTASIEAEEFDEPADPIAILSALKKERRKRADLFTFMQRIPDTKPKYGGYFMEWDNVAAVPISTFENWWTCQVNDKTRNMVRKLGKKGGEIRIAKFDDSFAAGISRIYNESPIRQGKKFWHYGKPLDTVKKENGTFLDRSIFIGAYYENELIGFVKLVCLPAYASMMQIISMIRHRDKAPTNALLAKAIEICAEKKIPYLTYAKFVYGRKGIDSLADFKRHNAFERIDLPRFYVPLTLRGRIVLKLGLHHGFLEVLPHQFVKRLLGFRAKWNARRARKA